jgi:hypothetical protein
MQYFAINKVGGLRGLRAGVLGMSWHACYARCVGAINHAKPCQKNPNAQQKKTKKKINLASKKKI